MAYRLENWSAVTSNPYLAPELRKIRLSGFVYGHPDHEDGTFVTTSSIVSANGRFIETKSGSKYELGEVDSNYLEYLESIGYQYDPDRPVKVYDTLSFN